MSETRLACFLTLAVVALACGTAPGAAGTAATPAAPAGPPPQVTPERIAEGKALYEKGVCIACHGLNGSGTQNGPPLNDKNWTHIRGTFGQIESVIINGIQLSDVIEGYRRAMPARGLDFRTGDPALLNNAQVTAIAAYIYSISTGASKAP